MPAQVEPEKVRLLILDDNKVRHMLMRADIVAAFPFLRGFAERVNSEVRRTANTKGCSPCQKKTVMNVADYSQIRQILDRLPKPDKDRLLLMLNAQAIRMYYNNEQGQRVRATIS